MREHRYVTYGDAHATLKVRTDNGAKVTIDGRGGEEGVQIWKKIMFLWELLLDIRLDLQ